MKLGKRWSYLWLLCLLIVLPLCGCSKDNIIPTDVAYPRQDEYDKVHAFGDGYYLVSKFEETYNSATTKFGVVNEKGEWVCPLSDENGFAIATANVQNNYTKAYHSIEYDYIGEDMFLIRSACIILGEDEIPTGYRASYAQHGRCMIVNVNGTSVGTGGYIVTRFANGCAMW